MSIIIIIIIMTAYTMYCAIRLNQSRAGEICQRASCLRCGLERWNHVRSVVWVAACVRRAAHLGAVLARALRALLAASAAGASGVCLHISLRAAAEPWQIYRVGQESKLLMLSEYVNKTEKMGET